MAKPTVEEINTAISEWWAGIPDLPLRVNAVKEILWWFCPDGLHAEIESRGLQDDFIRALVDVVDKLGMYQNDREYVLCTATAPERARALYRAIQQNTPPGAGGSKH